jgi:hypothetical protein
MCHTPQGLPQRQLTQQPSESASDFLEQLVFRDTFNDVPGVVAGPSLLEGTGAWGLRLRDEGGLSPECEGDQVRVRPRALD